MSKFSLIALACALVVAFAARASADDVSIDDVPPEVKTAIEQHVGDGKVEDIERERRRGRTVYEIEFEDSKGRDFELVLAEDGSVISKRRD